METILLFLLVGIDLASAKADPWALPTPHAINNKHVLNQRAPLPTPAPRIKGRQGGITYNQLFARQYIAHTCGFIDGDAGSPYTCGAGTECALVGAYWQCCPMASASGSVTIDQAQCTDYVACVDYQSTSSYPNQGSIPYGTGSTVYCPSINPICFTATLIEAGTSTMYLSYGCYTDTLTATVYQNPTSGPVGSATPSNSPSSIAGGAISSSPTIASPVSSQPQATSASSLFNASPTSQSTTAFSIPQGTQMTSTGNGGQPASATGSSTTLPTPKPKPSHVGAIAGGVVGGIAGIALIGAAVGYLMYRKRQQRVEPMSEISPGYYAPSNQY